MDQLRNFIGGQWVDVSECETIEVLNPATESAIARLPLTPDEVVDMAVATAESAGEAWAALPLADRVGALFAAADSLERHAREIAAIEERDMGRPTRVGETWIRGAIAAFRRDLNLALDYPFTKVSDDSTTTISRRPLGCVAVIVPWNFPMNTTLGSLGSLLASGNTVVLKPSEKAPMSALRLVELMDLPDGVVNLVLGAGSVGAHLSQHPSVALTHFTGSVASGTAVAMAGARRLHRVVLELGGKDPVLIDEGIDVKVVAQDVARGSFTNTGQICTSMERIYVHRSISDEFIAELTAAAKLFRYSDDPSDATPIGPMVDDGQRSVVARHVDDAVSRGAVVHTGGSVPQKAGYWYPATVLSGVTDDMIIMREETFGPVAPVRVVEDFEQAVAEAKRSPYGLGATIYTPNERRAEKAAREIPAAITWINQWQARGQGVIYEPSGLSGMTAIGHDAAFDAATRPASVVISR